MTLLVVIGALLIAAILVTVGVSLFLRRPNSDLTSDARDEIQHEPRRPTRS